ncbi:catalase [Saitoella complicata NRRL Y-17804]|uniref:Catalase core domain-containing protein n=1 Tax=Saitoella complicata (strain BCRC 22490 / CBS 7301 / JCM 7358 / NBRC 10748 / NRRL Y-17804) TaxID=698492 RepID=A0A0E9NSN9_SAICN|nr:catalase [Saitoella complicata NRRL Y-17804]ODQ53759.1 catalase [Saitoella complicata NRRL Y-17804]GAO52450.1 hypothetical protein G7K_6526-t1 [Saitoella complicata NRRL Y-17804]
MASLLHNIAQDAAEVAGKLGLDPRPVQKATLFQGANKGPAETAACITGVQETHVKEDNAPYLTNNYGIPWPTTNHSLNVGGIPVASDTFLFEKQQTFNRSKTLERMVHPCGSGAFGYFEVTQDVSDLCKADFLSEVGKKTPVFVRFSTVTFGREFPDSGRNPRGFAIKFYTGEGNYDIVGLNWPIFFCRDPMQGPDVIRSQQRNPQNFLLDFDSLFDFLAMVPESNHAGLMFFSDHGTPNGWRFEHGYGAHTFKWVNKDGGAVYVKYHFIAKHGQKQFTWEEAVRMSGEDPDYSKRDLWAAIERGEEIEWKAMYQVMTLDEAAQQDFDPFDVTKVWPRGLFPMKEFGKLVLNRNPEDYHRDVEQSAFSPGSMVPGIEPSPDMLLQFRTFFYRDAQFHRLGVNLHQIPVNCPFMSQSYSSINNAGPMRVDANTGQKPHYWPNSYNTPKFRQDVDYKPVKVADNILSRQSHSMHEGKFSEYTQATELYRRVMDDGARANTHKNTVAYLKWVEPRIQKLYLSQCYCIAPEYARGIYDLLPEKKFEFGDVEELAKTAPMRGKEEEYMPKEDWHRLIGVDVDSKVVPTLTATSISK